MPSTKSKSKPKTKRPATRKAEPKPPVEPMTQPSDPAQTVPADVHAAYSAQAGEPETGADNPMPQPPGTIPQEALAGEGDLDGMEMQWRENPETKEWEKVPVPKGTPAVLIGTDLSAGDGFAIGPEYRQGQWAEFDFYWMNQDPNRNLDNDRNGWRAMRQSVDGRDRIVDGVVMRGDMVLAHRPKDLTRVVQGQQQAMNDRMMDRLDVFTGGHVLSDRELEDAVGGEGDLAPTRAYRVTAGHAEQIDPRQAGQRARMPLVPDLNALREADAIQRGKRSFVINAPFQEERYNIAGGRR